MRTYLLCPACPALLPPAAIESMADKFGKHVILHWARAPTIARSLLPPHRNRLSCFRQGRAAARARAPPIAVSAAAALPTLCADKGMPARFADGSCKQFLGISCQCWCSQEQRLGVKPSTRPLAVVSAVSWLRLAR